VTKSDSGVQILWSDDHVSVHPWTLLKGAMPNATRSIPRDGQIPFDSTIAEKPREISYDAVMNETDSSGMAKLTNDIHVHGFCFVVDTPVTPEATEKLLEKIGPIRNTHYGGFYDFIPDQAMADTAYTNIALAAHTDTTYFSEPARLQAFHMLSHQQPPDYTPEEGELGGRSLLVDGFKAAEDLLSRDPASYSILQNTHIPWHASGNDGITIAPYKAFPVIETMDTGKRIRWNNGDRGVIDWRASRHWYHAAEKFDSFVKDPHNEYWFQLRPGRVLSKLMLIFASK
jgi:trimethyllysine dioxygenase